MRIKPDLNDIKTTLTDSPVLLPIPRKEKGPRLNGWTTFNYQITQEPGYQNALQSSTNIGVLLGEASSHLCAFDFDTPAALEDFLAGNPVLANSFRVRGERGAQIYAYLQGERPTQVYKLKVDASSPLAVGAKPPGSDGLCQIGEFRAEGGQSVLIGEHPSSVPGNEIWYQWIIDAPPVTFSFNQVIWHPDIHLPWVEGNTEHREATTPGEKSSLQMAIEKLSIDFLWDHFSYGPKKGNPVKSPFRNESHPSFSIYRDKRGKQKFKDHGHPEHAGDSFDFFRQARKLEEPKRFSEALRQFLELAGMLEPELELGEEMPEESRKASQRYSAPLELKPPPIGPEAFIGFCGDWIAALEPQTECNRDNLLLQFLAVFGAMAGRYHYNYYGQNLFPNLYVVVLGDSGMARKGTALNQAKDFIRIFEPEWRGIRGGWQSGEALVHHTRDPEYNAKGDTIRDQGVSDKRVLACENELFQVFRVGDRQGNTLIVKFREAWDSPEFMANTSKNSPQIATAPHIGLIGHMTRAELVTTDPANISNGFVNRILWIHAFRARLIPNPEPIQWPEKLLTQFAAIKSFAQQPTEMNITSVGAEPQTKLVPLDANAKLLWEKIYYESPSQPGTLGAILERFTSQIRKLALLYALLDQSPVITRDHLLAGLAIAKHSRDCVRLTFSSFTPNKLANKILIALRRILPSGLSREEIYDHVTNKHGAKSEIEEALSQLQDNTLAEVKVFRTKGRPKEVWSAIKRYTET